MKRRSVARATRIRLEDKPVFKSKRDHFKEAEIFPRTPKEP